MIEPNQRDYQRIARLIDYLVTNSQEQVSLERLSALADLSPWHVQRLFTQYVGLSPKQFSQHLKADYAKQILQHDEEPLLHVAYEVGLSSASRLHDLFIRVEAMTPGTFKQGGAGLVIYHSFAQTLFGGLSLGSTDIGICHLVFADTEAQGRAQLIKAFPRAILVDEVRQTHKSALAFFDRDLSQPIALHLQGSAFQMKVWRALLSVPAGRLISYKQLAHSIGQPKSARAIGQALGKNPIAVLIPCHRVIQKAGLVGGYKWNAARKQALIAWETKLDQVSA